jgi:AbrB family looped-hinge helix DNA binding protein
MDSSLLTSKGQLLIPKRLRVKYGIHPGQMVIFSETKAGLLIKPMDEAYFNQFVGILKDHAPTRKEIKNWKTEDKLREEKKASSSSPVAKRSR